MHEDTQSIVPGAFKEMQCAREMLVRVAQHHGIDA